MRNLYKNFFEKSSSAYNKFYNSICFAGKTPNILHYSYLSTYELHPDVEAVLRNRGGDIVDFGCGNTPYRELFSKVKTYTGIDCIDGPYVDIVVHGPQIPLPDSSCDVILSTQVFEHVETLDYLKELSRILRPKGELIISVPFLYGVHDSYDFRRFTDAGLVRLLKEHDLHVKFVKTQGGIGSTIVVMFLFFLKLMIAKTWFTKALQFPALPFWLIFCFTLNCVGRFFDMIDSTKSFYNNVLVVAEKK